MGESWKVLLEDFTFLVPGNLQIASTGIQNDGVYRRIILEVAGSTILANFEVVELDTPQWSSLPRLIRILLKVNKFDLCRRVSVRLHRDVANAASRRSFGEGRHDLLAGCPDNHRDHEKEPKDEVSREELLGVLLNLVGPSTPAAVWASIRRIA